MVQNKTKEVEQKQFDVLVVGELNVDLILNQLEKFPEVGKEIIANKMTFTLGSSSAIFASNLSTLGTKVAFFGLVGNDNFANKILEDLSRKNVSTGFIKHSKTADTGISVAFNFNEDRAMVTYPGAMIELSEKDVTNEILSSAKHLHVSSIFLQPSLKPDISKLFKRAKELGLTTSLDPQWDPSENWNCNWEELLPNVDIFLPNIEELKSITKRSSVQECIESIKHFTKVLAIKNGSDGAIVFSADEMIYQPAFINNEIADAIGAGDSFDAGFIYKYVNKKKLKVCCEFGALCGAINTTKSGGTTAFENLESIKNVALKKFNYTIE